MYFRSSLLPQTSKCLPPFRLVYASTFTCMFVYICRFLHTCIPFKYRDNVSNNTVYLHIHIRIHACIRAHTHPYFFFQVVLYPKNQQYLKMFLLFFLFPFLLQLLWLYGYGEAETTPSCLQASFISSLLGGKPCHHHYRGRNRKW